MGKTVAFFAITVFVLLPFSAPGEPLRVKNLRVFDARGKRVGEVMAAGVTSLASVMVPLRAQGYVFALEVFPDRFSSFGLIGTQNEFVFFEKENCLGNPFLSVPFGSFMLPVVAVAPPGSTVYLADPEGVPRTVPVKSRLSASTATNPGGICENLGGGFFVGRGVLALPLVDLDEHFTPPFRVR